MKFDLGFLGDVFKWFKIGEIVDTVLPWLSANGTLSLAILALAGFPFCLMLAHKSEKIPVKVPFAADLGRLNVTLVIVFYLLAILGIGAMVVKDVVAPPAPSADSEAQLPYRASRPAPGAVNTYDAGIDK